MSGVCCRDSATSRHGCKTLKRPEQVFAGSSCKESVMLVPLVHLSATRSLDEASALANRQRDGTGLAPMGPLPKAASRPPNRATSAS
jgi:hypothetical protein